MAFMVGSVFFAANARTETLDSEQMKMLDMANALPGAALQFDGDGEMLLANVPALKLFGLSQRDIKRTGLLDLFTGDDETSGRLVKAFDTAKNKSEMTSTTIEAPLGFNNGPDEPTTLSLDFVPRDDGSVFAFIADNSEKSARLEELEVLQEMAEKEASEKTLFFAGVSHELRTPLNAIIGFSDMMRSRLFGPLPGKYAEYADLIHDSGQHMLDLIGDVLDISKVGAGKYELNYSEFDIADVIRSSIKMVRPSADAADLVLDVEIDPNADMIIEADRRAVRQILLNLLSNAIKFTPKGGRVVVSAKPVDNTLNISVEDNGAGMTEEELSIIGTPYTQASTAGLVKTRGTGLGLSLVKTFVELHHGRLALTSHPGSGTTANIYLPMNRETT
jgi:cell cycle sensor histidine kinase DivJ